MTDQPNVWDGVERRSGRDRRRGQERRGEERTMYDRRSGLDRRGHPLYTARRSRMQREETLQP